MTLYLLKDGRTVEGGVAIDFDSTHTNPIYRLTPEEYDMFVQEQLPDPPPPSPSKNKEVLSQDIISEFTPDDAGKIKAAVNSSNSLWLLWSAFQAQKDPMNLDNERFLRGWEALKTVVGVSRMADIAAKLNLDI